MERRNKYINQNLLDLFTKGFSFEELKVFCFTGGDQFEEFLNQQKPNISFITFIIELLEFARRRDSMEVLLNWAQQENPVKYDLHQPYSWDQPQEDVAQSYRLTRDRIIEHFMLKEDSPEIAIYISRHSTTTSLPTISTLPDDISDNPALKRITDFQIMEAEQKLASQQFDLRAFAVVSAIELIEASRLIAEIDRSNLLDWFSKDFQESLPERINIKLDICPEQDVYKGFLEKGTVIFIGGPRANLGTFYYLFGEELGEMRPKRSPAHIVESIKNPAIQIESPSDRNLGIIQRYGIKGGQKAIFYLAGTGINGTAAAVAYTRLHWLDLHEEFGDDNYCRVIEVDRRKTEDIPGYISKDWTDNDWIVHK